MHQGIAASLFLVPFCVSVLFAQDSTRVPRFAPLDPIPELVSFFAPFFLPKLFNDVQSLRLYIQGEEFSEFRRSYGDDRSLDAIFYQAVRLSWNNIYEALFISLIATLDHRTVGINLPVIGPLLWIPLTSEFQEEFQRRVHALPGQLYHDSPPGPDGDRDKLQHFFGSAFVTYVSERPEQAEALGAFIEVWEERIIVEGALDDRDIRANEQGQLFGAALLQGGPTRPSRFLDVTVPTAQQIRQISDSLEVIR